MKLSLKTFFQYYIFNFKDLPPIQQKKARIGSIVIGIFSFGLVHLVCRTAFYKRSLKPIEETPKITHVRAQVFGQNEKQPIYRKSKLLPVVRKFLEQQKMVLRKEEIRLKPAFRPRAQRKSNPDLKIFNSQPVPEAKALPRLDKPKPVESTLKQIPKISIPKLYFPTNYSIGELAKLKVGDIKAPGEQFIEQYGTQILSLEQSIAGKAPESLTSFDQLYLVDIFRLEAKAINSIHEKLPPLVFFFISPSEVPHLNLNQLSNERLHCLFLSKRAAKACTDTQILDVYKRVDAFLLGHLSTKQLQTFIKKIPICEMNSSRFEACFNSKAPLSPTGSIIDKKPRAAKLMEELELIHLLQWNKYFSDIHWSYLTDRQIDSISNPQRLGINKAVFSFIFPPQLANTRERIGKINLDRIGLWLEFFSDKHWTYLTDAQIDKIKSPKDFGMTKEIFRSMFPLSELEAHKRIQDISSTNLEDWLPFFSSKHWSFLSDPQIDKIQNPEICGMTREVFLGMFPPSKLDTSERIKKIPKTKIHLWLPYFSEGHWPCLSDSQIAKVENPKAFGMNKTIFAKMFDPSTSSTSKRIEDMEREVAEKWYEFFSEKHRLMCIYNFN